MTVSTQVRAFVSVLKMTRFFEFAVAFFPAHDAGEFFDHAGQIIHHRQQARPAATSPKAKKSMQKNHKPPILRRLRCSEVIRIAETGGDGLN